MQKYTFNALLSRMKYITRWGLMRSARSENLSEHTAETSVLAHTLSLISKHIYKTDVRSEVVAIAALYHDASEILTGDMPTPVKYKNDTLKKAYKQLENDAATSLCTLLPSELQGEMHGFLTGDCLTKKEAQILKAADRLSALIKCIEEQNSGNNEFAGAKQHQLSALKEMNCPEADYFIENMLSCYSMTLDELAISW